MPARRMDDVSCASLMPGPGPTRFCFECAGVVYCAPLLNESRALSGSCPGPQCAESRTPTQRARALRIGAGSEDIGNLKSILYRYYE